MSNDKSPKLKSALRVLYATFFIFVGSRHFMSPKRFIEIVPAVLPYPRELVFISGFFEILGGIGLLVKPTRRVAGFGLMALLLAVFPANINMAVNKIDFGFIPTWLLWARLPLQLLLIGAADKASRD